MEYAYYKQKQKQKRVQYSWTTNGTNLMISANVKPWKHLQCASSVYELVRVNAIRSSDTTYAVTVLVPMNHFKDFSLHSCNVHAEYEVCKHASMHTFLPSWFWRSSEEACTLMSYLSSLQSCKCRSPWNNSMYIVQILHLHKTVLTDMWQHFNY